MTLDELYGCTIGEYLAFHGKSKDALISEIEKDIQLLEKSKNHYVKNKDLYSLERLIESTEINKLIERKEIHLERIKMWND